MATVTDPIILDSTGQAIKNSIDLLAANINRTASNIPYDSNLTIKAAIDGKVSKAGDIMTDTLQINKEGSDSELMLGNTSAYGSSNKSKGVLTLCSETSKVMQVKATHITADRVCEFPDNAGTIALTSDLDGVVSSSVDFTPLSTPIFTKESLNVVQLGKLVLVNVRLKAVSALSADVERQCGTFSNLISQGYIAGSVCRNNNSRPTGGFVIPTSTMRLYIHLTEALAQDDIVMFSFQAFVN